MKKPSLDKIIKDNVNKRGSMYNKKYSSLPDFNLRLPQQEEYSEPMINPYMYNVHPYSDVQGMGFGVQAQKDLGRFNLSGGVSTEYIPGQKANPYYNAGVSYTFDDGGTYLTDRAMATQFGQYKMGGGYFPEYHSFAPPRMSHGGDPSIPDLNPGMMLMHYAPGGNTGYPSPQSFGLANPRTLMGRQSGESITTPPMYNPYANQNINLNSRTGQGQVKALMNAGQTKNAAQYAVRNKKFTGNQQEALNKRAQLEHNVTLHPNYDPTKSIESQAHLADDQSLDTKIYRGARSSTGNPVLDFAWNIMSAPGKSTSNLAHPSHYVKEGVAGVGSAALDLMTIAPGLGIEGGLGKSAAGTAERSALKQATTNLEKAEASELQQGAHHLGEHFVEGTKHQGMHHGVESLHGEHTPGSEITGITPFYPTMNVARTKMKYGGGMYAYAGGGSIVDYLNSTGEASDFNSRAARAKQMGIQNYTGTAEQNLAMLSAIQGQDRGKRIARQEKQNPHIMAAPQATPSAEPQPGIPYFPHVGGVMPHSAPTPSVKKTGDARQAATQKTKQANKEMSAPYPVQQPQWMHQMNQQLGLEDARHLESGMITDKNKNVMYVVKNGKVVKSMPVLTGQARDANANPYSVEYLESHPEARATPTGTYLSTPNPNLYGKKGFNMKPIPAFGEAAPNSANVAQHTIYGTNPNKGQEGYDPREGARRTKLMKGPGENRNASYGCTNLYGQDIDCLTGQIFPQGDTTIVVDTRKGKDAAFLRNMGIKATGGENDYSGTYSNGVYYGDGGSFVPEFYEPGVLPQFAMGYNVPQAMYGMGMAQGGLVKGSIHDMSEGEIQNLINQGYKIQYL